MVETRRQARPGGLSRSAASLVALSRSTLTASGRLNSSGSQSGLGRRKGSRSPRRRGARDIGPGGNAVRWHGLDRRDVLNLSAVVPAYAAAGGENVLRNVTERTETTRDRLVDYPALCSRARTALANRDVDTLKEVCHAVEKFDKAPELRALVAEANVLIAQHDELCDRGRQATYDRNLSAIAAFSNDGWVSFELSRVNLQVQEAYDEHETAYARLQHAIATRNVTELHAGVEGGGRWRSPEFDALVVQAQEVLVEHAALLERIRTAIDARDMRTFSTALKDFEVGWNSAEVQDLAATFVELSRLHTSLCAWIVRACDNRDAEALAELDVSGWRSQELDRLAARARGIVREHESKVNHFRECVRLGDVRALPKCSAEGWASYELHGLKAQAEQALTEHAQLLVDGRTALGAPSPDITTLRNVASRAEHYEKSRDLQMLARQVRKLIAEHDALLNRANDILQRGDAAQLETISSVSWDSLELEAAVAEAAKKIAAHDALCADTERAIATKDFKALSEVMAKQRRVAWESERLDALIAPADELLQVHERLMISGPRAMDARDIDSLVDCAREGEGWHSESLEEILAKIRALIAEYQGIVGRGRMACDTKDISGIREVCAAEYWLSPELSAIKAEAVELEQAYLVHFATAQEAAEQDFPRASAPMEDALMHLAQWRSEESMPLVKRLQVLLADFDSMCKVIEEGLVSGDIHVLQEAPQKLRLWESERLRDLLPRGQEVINAWNDVCIRATTALSDEPHDVSELQMALEAKQRFKSKELDDIARRVDMVLADHDAVLAQAEQALEGGNVAGLREVQGVYVSNRFRSPKLDEISRTTSEMLEEYDEAFDMIENAIETKHIPFLVDGIQQMPSWAFKTAKRGARERRRGGRAGDYDRHRTLIQEARELEESYAKAIKHVQTCLKRPMQVGLSGALSALDEVCATPLEVHEEILEKAGRRPVRPDRRASVAASKARLHWGLLRNAYKTQGMQALDPNAKRMADAVLQAIAEAEERADIQEAQDASQVDADMTWTGIGQDSEVLDELPAPQHDGEAPGPPQDFAETGESPPEVGQS